MEEEFGGGSIEGSSGLLHVIPAQYRRGTIDRNTLASQDYRYTPLRPTDAAHVHSAPVIPAGNSTENASHKAAHEKHACLPVKVDAQFRTKVQLPHNPLLPVRHGVEDPAAVEAVEPEKGHGKRRPGRYEEHLRVRWFESWSDLLSRKC